MYFVRKWAGDSMKAILSMGLLVMLCLGWPITAQAAEDKTEEDVVPIETEAEVETTEVVEAAQPETVAEVAEPIDVAFAAEEGAIMLGEFRLTYYCCERHRHICGDGKGLTASGRPLEAGRSIAVDPSVIPLGSRVWIDFGDGEGWHEYSADDTGSLVEDNHIDIAIETHREALHQSKVAGRVCYMPPQDFQDSLDEKNPASSGDFS